MVSKLTGSLLLVVIAAALWLPESPARTYAMYTLDHQPCVYQARMYQVLKRAARLIRESFPMRMSGSNPYSDPAYGRADRVLVELGTISSYHGTNIAIDKKFTHFVIDALTEIEGATSFHYEPLTHDQAFNNSEYWKYVTKAQASLKAAWQLLPNAGCASTPIGPLPDLQPVRSGRVSSSPGTSSAVLPVAARVIPSTMAYNAYPTLVASVRVGAVCTASIRYFDTNRPPRSFNGYAKTSTGVVSWSWHEETKGPGGTGTVDCGLGSRHGSATATFTVTH